VTVIEVIQRSAGFLERKGVDSARLAAELILARVLRLPRLQLYLNFERSLAEPELEQMRELVQRRARREPLQHILGTVSFCGIELEVNKDVLIPRPETEVLAEKAWTLAKEWASGNPVALDFGTGSGCLAIALAARAPQAQLHALDVSPAALAVARRNAVKHLPDGRIVFHESNGFVSLPPALRFDLLVSNPPYIATAEIDTLEPEVKDFDPRLALDGGADGLDFYRRLAAEAPARLAPGGHLLAEFGDGQSPALEALFNAPPWRVVEVLPDFTRRPRHLHAVVAG
jgi:release factor glutamine methyltransferase